MTKKLMVLAAAVGAATTVFGAGMANADPDLSDKTWSEASSTLKSQGMTGKVSAQVGDRLQQGDCIVIGQSKSAAPPHGFPNTSRIVLVSLDCNGALATPGHPGYSAASPKGRAATEAAAEDQKSREWIATSDGQNYCKYAKPDDQYAAKYCGG